MNMKFRGDKKDEKLWYVVDENLKIVEKFKRVYAAKRFAAINKKNYFHFLDVITKDTYEFKKQEK